MSELNAILGLASLEMAEDNIGRRHHLIDLHKKRLGQLPGIRFQKTTPGGVSNGVYFSIIIDSAQFGLTRDQLYQSLKFEHVDTRRYYYPPLHQQTAYSHLTPLYRDKLPHTERISSCSLTLPMFSHMTDEQANGVCDAVERLYENREQLQSKWVDITSKESR
jgi:dTDP-4-amino-4,6-dideoxygalactose transaminase